MRLFTQRGYDGTERYPLIRKAWPPWRKTRSWMARRWRATKQALRILLHSREHDRRAFLYAFDLLELDGVDLRPLPLEQRKDELRNLLFGYRPGIHFSEHLEHDEASVFAPACRLGCEGILSKDRSRPYRSGPSKT